MVLFEDGEASIKMNRSAEADSKINRKMKDKEDFARLISDVYNKNENVDYD
jgi:hypothetical protein